VWWSRLARPALKSWSEADQVLHLVEQAVATNDPDPKALACYGLLVRWAELDATAGDTSGGDESGSGWHEEAWLRFVDGRPVSAVTTRYLAWCCERLAAAGKEALLLVWDNASWHVSREVRRWIRAHNREAKQAGGVRIIAGYLPSKSPWLNPIEPKWAHGKRRVVEPAGVLSAHELADRVCAAFGCSHEPHLSISDYVA
jgi:transposase